MFGVALICSALQILIVGCILHDQTNMHRVLVWDESRSDGNAKNTCDANSWLNALDFNSSTCIDVKGSVINDKGTRIVVQDTCGHACPAVFGSFRTQPNVDVILGPGRPSLQLEYAMLGICIFGFCSSLLFERPAKCQGEQELRTDAFVKSARGRAQGAGGMPVGELNVAWRVVSCFVGLGVCSKWATVEQNRYCTSISCAEVQELVTQAGGSGGGGGSCESLAEPLCHPFFSIYFGSVFLTQPGNSGIGRGIEGPWVAVFLGMCLLFLSGLVLATHLKQVRTAREYAQQTEPPPPQRQQQQQLELSCRQQRRGTDEGQEVEFGHEESIQRQKRKTKRTKRHTGRGSSYTVVNRTDNKGVSRSTGFGHLSSPRQPHTHTHTHTHTHAPTPPQQHGLEPEIGHVDVQSGAGAGIQTSSVYTSPCTGWDAHASVPGSTASVKPQPAAVSSLHARPHSSFLQPPFPPVPPVPPVPPTLPAPPLLPPLPLSQLAEDLASAERSHEQARQQQQQQQQQQQHQQHQQQQHQHHQHQQYQQQEAHTRGLLLSARDCPICYEAFGAASVSAPISLPCSHVFHEDCMAQWCESSQGFSDVCPVCRADVPYSVGARLMQVKAQACRLDAI